MITALVKLVADVSKPRRKRLALSRLAALVQAAYKDCSRACSQTAGCRNNDNRFPEPYRNLGVRCVGLLKFEAQETSEETETDELDVSWYRDALFALVMNIQR
jgi:hypothetical protein